MSVGAYAKVWGGWLEEPQNLRKEDLAYSPSTGLTLGKCFTLSGPCKYFHLENTGIEGHPGGSVS